MSDEQFNLSPSMENIDQAKLGQEIEELIEVKNKCIEEQYMCIDELRKKLEVAKDENETVKI